MYRLIPLLLLINGSLFAQNYERIYEQDIFFNNLLAMKNAGKTELIINKFSNDSLYGIDSVTIVEKGKLLTVKEHKYWINNSGRITLTFNLLYTINLKEFNYPYYVSKNETCFTPLKTVYCNNYLINNKPLKKDIAIVDCEKRDTISTLTYLFTQKNKLYDYSYSEKGVKSHISYRYNNGSVEENSNGDTTLYKIVPNGILFTDEYNINRSVFNLGKEENSIEEHLFSKKYFYENSLINKYIYLTDESDGRTELRGKPVKFRYEYIYK